MKFIPTNKKEMKAEGFEQADFIIITGDAYVDHPSFGTSLIARYLQAHNYKVAIIAQPSLKDENVFKKCGTPRLAFLVSSGNIDSMVNNYYVSKNKRKKDVYALNGKFGKRPDYATSVYSQELKKIYPEIPVIIGGIEASLRRFAHYDYWSNKILPSILLSSYADLLVYGMGEKMIIEIADYLNSGMNIKDLTFIKGTVYKSKSIDNLQNYVLLPSFKEIKSNKDLYLKSFMEQFNNNEAFNSKILVEPYNDDYIIQNPANYPLSKVELDHLYDLPFTYESYDEYHNLGIIPALEEVKFSINVNRGCNGGCNFCAITFHQGKQISMRSKDSCIDEAKKMTTLKDFKGYIHDVGGPTANFNDQMCDKLQNYGSCKDKPCLGFKMCNNIKVDHKQYFEILRGIRKLPKIKKVFVRSGIRYDYMLKDDDKYLKELAQYHVSGQLRLAPEHISDNVLKLMSKPPIKDYERFVAKFDKINEDLKMKQYAVPYLMSSHPGATIDDAIDLALYLKKIKYRPLQAQDFYPTPSTISTLMYYTEKNPFNNKKIYVAKSDEDKAIQRALLQYHLPQNKNLIMKALKKSNKEHLAKKIL